MKSADKLSSLDIYINKLLQRNDKNQQGFMAFLKFSEGNFDINKYRNDYFLSYTNFHNLENS